MQINLKICGMANSNNIKTVAQLQPNYLGFIFYKKSPRYFNGKIPKLPNTIKKVGVFVNETIETVLKIVKQHQLHVVQLHGNESPEFCKTLKQQYKAKSSLEVIKVFGIKSTFNFSILKPYEGIADYYLFDTKGKHPGGNGYIFNWEVLNQYPSKTPFFLSGGIGNDQIENLKHFFKSSAAKYCYAIDVNSKFEIQPGLKDFELLKQFKHHLHKVAKVTMQ